MTMRCRIFGCSPLGGYREYASAGRIYLSAVCSRCFQPVDAPESLDPVPAVRASLERGRREAIGYLGSRWVLAPRVDETLAAIEAATEAQP